MRFEVVRWSFVAFAGLAFAFGIARTAIGDAGQGDLSLIALQLTVAAAFILSVHVGSAPQTRLAAVNDAVAMALFIYALHVLSAIGDAGLDPALALTAPLSRTYLSVILAALVVVPLLRISLPLVIGGEVASLARELGAKLVFVALITLVFRWAVTDPSLANLRAFVAATVFFFLFRSVSTRVPVIGQIRADQIAPVLLVAVCLFSPNREDWQIELGILAAIGLLALIARLWPVLR